MIGIYKITCANNQKVYIGSSKNIHQRWAKHRHKLRKEIANPNMQNSYNKYGESSFIYEILETCEIENLIERESFWAKKYKEDNIELFNSGEFIDNPSRGTKLPKERIENLKIRFSGNRNPAYGKKWIYKGDEIKYVKQDEIHFYIELGYTIGLSEIHKKNISKRQKEIGRKPTEHNLLILKEILRKPKSDEHRKKISETRTKILGVKIKCLETGEVFDSYTKAAEKFNICYQAIRQSIINKGTCCKHTFQKI